MRYVSALSALVALAAAAPSPQDIDLSVLDAAPPPSITGPPVTAISQSIAFDPSATAAAVSASIASDPLSAAATSSSDGSAPIDVSRRQNDVNAPCGVQPSGSGPVPTPDTPAAFSADPYFADEANHAQTPSGYTEVFKNLNGSVNGNVYMGLNTLTAYDPSQCAALCNAATGCVAFNLYFERDPTLNPATGCDNPPSLTNIKCTLWGADVTAAMAVNTGQSRDNFIVVIAGSNGYNLGTTTPPPSPCPGFNHPQPFPGAVNHPGSCLGSKFFPVPFDPSICAAACIAETEANKGRANHGRYQPCNFFTSYVLAKNQCSQGMYCSFYTETFGPGDGNNQGQHLGSDFFSIIRAFGYELSQQDPGQINGRH